MFFLFKNRRRLESTCTCTSFRTQGLAGSARKTKRVQDGLKLLMAMPRKLSATKRMRMTHHEKRVGFAEPAAVVASLEKSAQLPLKVAAEASKQEAAAAAAQRTKDKKYHKNEPPHRPHSPGIAALDRSCLERREPTPLSIKLKLEPPHLSAL